MTKKRQIPLYTVDAFTKEHFGGNPAAVCLLSEDYDTDTCQKIAFEMNLAETAFIRLLNKNDTFDKSSKFGLRWFTPTHEVPLCGHATLASSKVLFQICGNVNKQVQFETMSGILNCHNLSDGIISMDFPQWNILKAKIDPTISEVVRETVNGLPVKDVQYSPDGKMLFIVVDESVTREQFEKIKVDTRKIVDIQPDADKFFILSITMRGTLSNGCVDNDGKVYDFVSRCFAPWYGIDEDPVTGSLHCLLGPYWKQILNKPKLYARQCSARGGELNLNVRLDGRIDLIGNSVIVVSGTLNL